MSKIFESFKDRRKSRKINPRVLFIEIEPQKSGDEEIMIALDLLDNNGIDAERAFKNSRTDILVQSDKYKEAVEILKNYGLILVESVELDESSKHMIRKYEKEKLKKNEGINERFYTINRDQKDVYHRAIEYITGGDVERYHDEAKNYAYQIPKSKKWFTIPKDEVDDVVKHHGGSLMKENAVIDILYNHNMSDDFIWTDSGLQAISPSVAKAISDLLRKEGITSRVSGSSVILQDKWLKGDIVKKIPNMTDEDLENLIAQGYEHTTAREELKRRARLKNKPFFVSEGKIKQCITDLEDLLNTNDLEDIEGISNKISKLLKLNKKEVEIVQNVIQQYKDKVETSELVETILSKLNMIN